MYNGLKWAKACMEVVLPSRKLKTHVKTRFASKLYFSWSVSTLVHLCIPQMSSDRSLSEGGVPPNAPRVSALEHKFPNGHMQILFNNHELQVTVKICTRAQWTLEFHFQLWFGLLRRKLYNHGLNSTV